MKNNCHLEQNQQDDKKYMMIYEKNIHDQESPHTHIEKIFSSVQLVLELIDQMKLIKVNELN